jgi:ferredoxin
MSPRSRLEVDPIGCTGHGICAELLPEMIRLDDWGYPILGPGPVPSDLLPQARRAVTACPALALRLVLERERSGASR